MRISFGLHTRTELGSSFLKPEPVIQAECESDLVRCDLRHTPRQVSKRTGGRRWKSEIVIAANWLAVSNDVQIREARKRRFLKNSRDGGESYVHD